MSKKILVIDDDPGALKLVESILTAKGYQVITLNYPKHVINIIKKENPDLVILDIIMPYKDGYKVCEEIKGLFSNRIPVMVCTSQPYEKEFIKDAHKDFGADDYLIKPFESKILLEKIDKLIKQKPPSQTQ